MKIKLSVILALCLFSGLLFGGLLPATPAMAMNAPGDGAEGWEYSQEDHFWYYYENGVPHTGWLEFHGDWYWFDGTGRMEEGGDVTIDGLPYYIFVNGHVARNQFVGLKYYDENGQREEKHDVRIIGSTPAMEDRDLFSDAMFEIPRGWIAQFVKDGWQMMFYTKKKYFAAPETDRGIYYVYHDVDLHYKKVKFTDPESATQAFGEYVGYAAGCYRADSARMKVLWQEQTAVWDILELPAYYAEDAQMYFGRLFAAYLDPRTQEELFRASPAVCEVMEEILRLKEDEAAKAWMRQQEEARKEEATRRQERMAGVEGAGPGMQ